MRDIMSCWMSYWMSFERWGTMSQRTPCGVEILRSHQPRTRPQYLRPVPASIGHVGMIVADSRAGPCVKWAVLQHVVLCCNMLCDFERRAIRALAPLAPTRARADRHARLGRRAPPDPTPPRPAPPRPAPPCPALPHARRNTWQCYATSNCRPVVVHSVVPCLLRQPCQHTGTARSVQTCSMAKVQPAVRQLSCHVHRSACCRALARPPDRAPRHQTRELLRASPDRHVSRRMSQRLMPSVSWIRCVLRP